jgi:hypothetical protein
LREHDHAVGIVLVTNLTGSCLGDKFGNHATFDYDAELCGAGVGVWGIETASTNCYQQALVTGNVEGFMNVQDRTKPY